MRISRAPRLDTTILGASSLLAIAISGDSFPMAPAAVLTGPAERPVVAGNWRNADGSVRLVLKTDLTYDLSVAGRDRKAHGSYLLDGSELRLRDDTGLRTPARVSGGTLIEMAGHDLYPV